MYLSSHPVCVSTQLPSFSPSEHTTVPQSRGFCLWWDRADTKTSPLLWWCLRLGRWARYDSWLRNESFLTCLPPTPTSIPVWLPELMGGRKKKGHNDLLPSCLLQEPGGLGGEQGKPQVDRDSWECYTETGLCVVSLPFTWSSPSFPDKWAEQLRWNTFFVNGTFR